jgi:hypothetical protein
VSGQNGVTLVGGRQGFDAEAFEEKAVESRPDDKVERRVVFREQAARSGSRRLDQTKCLTQGEVAIFRDHLGRHVDEQAKLADTPLFLSRSTFVDHHAWGNPSFGHGHSSPATLALGWALRG